MGRWSKIESDRKEEEKKDSSLTKNVATNKPCGKAKKQIQNNAC